MRADESLRDERGRHFEVEDAVSTYREFIPASSLKEHVLCIWTQTIATARGGYSHLVLPDACVDIVFINNDAPVIVGPWTESFVANLAAGTTIVGVRFHPGRAPSLLGVPADRLLNQSVPLDAMSGGPLRDRLSGIADKPNLAAKRSALEAGLLHSLPNRSPIDQSVGAAIRWLARDPNAHVQQLSNWIGLSSRQLQRRFSSAVGYGPKTFHSILRFQRVLYLASGEHKDKTLADLALQAGYTDQSHMTREVRRFSGTPPKGVLRSSPCTLRLCDWLASKRLKTPL
jgi:AraC-like DNA-binding protein